MNQRIIAVTLPLIFYAVGSFVTARADTIRYSWSGQLVPNDASSPDPWMIGPEGKPFELEVAVARSAADLSEQSIEVSAFAVLHANLLLDGQVLTFAGGGIVDYFDGNPVYDLLSFAGEFERFGETAEFSTVVSLPLSTFHFTQFDESLPAFRSTTNLTRSISGNRLYSAIVEQGMVISVVPEPSSSFLLFISGIASLIHRCRNRDLIFSLI
jgi:hypothetical protein